MNQMTRIDAAPVTDFRARFSSAEFERMVAADVFEDWKVELVDGELERMTPPMGPHVMRQSMVVGALMAAVRGTGLIAVAEAGIALDEGTTVACDAAVLARPVAEHRFLRPDEVLLIVEVAERTLSRDMGPKRRKYAAADVPVYWVIDGERSVVHICSEPVNGDYAQINTVRFGEPLPVPGTDATITLE